MFRVLTPASPGDPHLSFLVSVALTLGTAVLSSDSVMYTQLSLLLPHETMLDDPVPHAVGPGRAEPEPGPPSSQSASEAQLHVSAQMGGGGARREARAAVGAVDAVCVLGAGPPSLL